MDCYHNRYSHESTITWNYPAVNSKDLIAKGIKIDAMFFTLRESRRTSDPLLFRPRRTVSYPPEEGFTLDASALKPSDVCNVRVNKELVSLSGRNFGITDGRV